MKLLERLSEPEAVKAVSMDLSASFRPAVEQALPHAQMVVDHFHVIQHLFPIAMIWLLNTLKSPMRPQ